MAGGGTGGHLFPGIAIAQEFKAVNPATQVVFVSSANRLERTVLEAAAFDLRRIAVSGMKGRGSWNQISAAAKIPMAIITAIGILKELSPDLTIGLGSYSAGPVVMAAWLMRIPAVICEQNILPGITNRILARFVDRIYISFKNTRLGYGGRKVNWTGNPVRREVLATKAQDKGQGPFTVLIIGGSQGAHKINTTMNEALEHLQDAEGLQFVHQTGEADEAAVREAYGNKNIRAEARAFFEDMAACYHQADLIICRSGATTVAEITALGKAVIFIPFPYAADNHQVLNAADLADDGAAEIIVEKQLNGRLLAEKIQYYREHPQDLAQMAAKAGQYGKPDAAKNIVDDCYRLLNDR